MKKKLICALLALCIAATLAAFASSAEEHGHFYVDGVCECGERIEEKAKRDLSRGFSAKEYKNIIYGEQ